MNLSLTRIGFLTFVCTLMFFAVDTCAQTGTSTIRGVTSDAQGRVVAGAAVTLKNASTGFSRSQTTGAAGGYSFDLIPPGDYTLEAEAKGFKKSVRNVSALIGSVTAADVQLEVGVVSEVVQVEGTAAIVSINTEDATIGNTFVNEQITQLPMEARNVLSLLTLQPGVTYAIDSTATTNGSVNGARSDQSNVTLDGADINEAQTGRLNTPVLRLNSEAIEEFRVTTLNANSNQGRSSAAQVNLVTKSGTNNFHGAGFEFNRSTGFTSNSFFLNRIGQPRPALIRNTFGGAIGGPIVKNKLFFFYSYEGRRDKSQDSKVRTVPLASMGQGIVRVKAADCPTPTTCLPAVLITYTQAQLNNIFSGVGLNAAALAVLANAAQKYPANDFTVGDSSPNELMNTAGFRFSYPVVTKLNSSVAKFDANITSKQTLFVRLNYIVDHSSGEFAAPQFPDTPSPTLWSHPEGFVVGHTWTIGSNWVNNLHYGLTREAFSQIGDHNGNQFSFRFVFDNVTNNPGIFTTSRVTPVHNILDDVAWIKNKHTIQMGTNIRLISNNRISNTNAFDFAQTNPSGYQQGGNVISDPIDADIKKTHTPTWQLTSVSEAQNAATALIGRFSGYNANLTYDHSGKLLAPGSPTNRTFATQSYDFYVQDSWKMRRDLTLTLGLRYGLSRPVYETGGFEVTPNIPLTKYFNDRVASAAKGVPLDTLLTMNLSGPANGKGPMYPWDYKNFQPRIGVAWTPSFSKGPLKGMFGESGKTVIRGGFSIFSDYYGEALATAFDLNNTLGFSSSDQIPVNTYNVTSKPAPAFTGFGQDIRSLPNLSFSNSITFPQLKSQNMGERIEASLDSDLHTPKAYAISLTVERQLPAGLLFQLSYAGRIGKSLLAHRDAMALNDLVDPKSGMDWYSAATMLEKIRATRPPGNTAVTPIPYFENIFPADLATRMTNFYVAQQVCSSASKCVPSNFTPTQAIFWIARNFYGNDWTDLQGDIDTQRFGNGDPTLFFNSQYGALTAWSTIGNSYYNGLSLSLRQRIHGLHWDFNYTFSHSLDDASGLQTDLGYGSASFILNPIRQHDWYANSEFDIRHIINANAIFELPFGRGKWIGKNAGRGLDALIGGYQLSSIFHWSTGLPLGAPSDDARWATNWNVQSRSVLTKPLGTCVTKGDANSAPKLFGCDPKAAYQSFRNAYPGEGGQRSIFTLPGVFRLDAGLSKSFNMPWSEKQSLQLRWEVFNVTNTQHFGPMDLSRSGYGMRLDPAVRNLAPPKNWSNFTDIQGGAAEGRRVMQVGLRFSF
jgi:hypothetical protein